MIIYKVTNLENNMVYIGQTKMTLEHRKYYHYKSNKNNKFRTALREHPREIFKWEVIDECFNKTDMDNKEKHYISIFNSFKDGYNSTSGGSGGDTRSGHKSSKEHCDKISESLKNHPISDDIRKKISNTLKERYINNPPFKKEEIENIIFLYKNNKSINSISILYNSNFHTIKRLINRFENIKRSE